MTDERESKQTNESTLLCPRCVSQMLPVQRFGVTIDQCTGCGGVFLDRGELEQLSEAEAKFYAAQQQPQQLPPAGYAPQQYPAQPMYVESPRPRGFFGWIVRGGLLRWSTRRLSGRTSLMIEPAALSSTAAPRPTHSPPHPDNPAPAQVRPDHTWSRLQRPVTITSRTRN